MDNKVHFTKTKPSLEFCSNRCVKKKSEEKKKLTAKELIDKVRSKKGNEKPDSTPLIKQLPLIGKMKRSSASKAKKNAPTNEEEKSTTSENSNDKSNYLVNANYQYYVQWYMSSYGLDQYTAQYYAQYFMAVNGEYKGSVQPWLNYQAYYPSQPSAPAPPPPVSGESAEDSKTEPQQAASTDKSITNDDQMEVEPSDDLGDSKIEVGTADDSEKVKPESTVSTDVGEEKGENKDGTSSCEPEGAATDAEVKKKSPEKANDKEKTSNDCKMRTEIEKENETGNNMCETNKIKVIVPSTPLSANEMLMVNNSLNDDTHQGKYVDDSSDNLPSPPPPPPPPTRPTMTHLVSEQCIILPNGIKLPPGTEQIIIHPYPACHPLSQNFSADNYMKAFKESVQYDSGNLKPSSTNLSLHVNILSN